MLRAYAIKKAAGLFAILIMLAGCGISGSLRDRPDITSYHQTIPERTEISDTSFVSGNNFLRRNKQGLWELYVEGDPMERGLAMGTLTKELFRRQERVFLSKVDELVPSKFKKALLRKFLAWYNRKVYKHVPEEYKAEIYGLSRYASPEYNNLAEPYLRVLYFHGAHDIGHALQDLALVGCSSFAVRGDKTGDGSLLIGRNFDFYAGDEFAREKIVAFVNPDSGYKFMSVTWAGMIGVVSGMNEHGLTVTINAGKSKIPLVAKTPISIVTREILQYASTIEEAIAIAKKRSVFVSESIFVGSAADKKAVIIEVSPENFGVYSVPNSDRMICTNHFQSDAYKNDRRNSRHIEESHSEYRYERLEELLGEHRKITPEIAVGILRNKDGLHDKKIGYGNEKALNQLLAHHGVVFKPEQRLAWVSSNPYQLGEFVAYDLNTVFNRYKNDNPASVSVDSLAIAEDPFLYTKAYRNYEKYRQLKKKVQYHIQNKKSIAPETLRELRESNPDLWEVHYLIGKYYYQKKYYKAALPAFREAASKEVTTVPDREMLNRYIRKSENRSNR